MKKSTCGLLALALGVALTSCGRDAVVSGQASGHSTVTTAPPAAAAAEPAPGAGSGPGTQGASQNSVSAARAHERPPIPDPKAVQDQDLGLTEAPLSAQGIWWWDRVSFYVVAHQDDWQLFMNPDAYSESQEENTKMVFVYLTAGDAGRRSMVPGESYTLAREEGSERSVRFMSDVSTTSHKPTVRSVVNVGGHLIRRVAYGNTVTYYLRLPDGDPNGESTLVQLREGTTRLSAVDGSTVYANWADLSATLQKLVQREGQYTAELRFNLADPDPVINAGDHIDHRTTSQLAGEVLQNVPCAEQRLYQTYNTADLPINVTTDQLLNHAALFGIVESGRADKGFPGAWEPLHKSWLGKHYVRTIPAKVPTPCF